MNETELYKKIGSYICDGCWTINLSCFHVCQNCYMAKEVILKSRTLRRGQRRLSLQNYSRLQRGSVLVKGYDVLTLLSKNKGVLTMEDKFFSVRKYKYIDVYDYTWKPKGKK